MKDNSNTPVTLVSDEEQKKNKVLATVLILIPLLFVVMSIIAGDAKDITVSVVGLGFNIYFATQLIYGYELSTLFNIRMTLGVLYGLSLFIKIEGSISDSLWEYIFAGIQVLFCLYFLIQVNAKLSTKQYRLINYTALPLMFAPLLYAFVLILGMGKTEIDTRVELQNVLAKVPDELSVFNDTIHPLLNAALTAEDDSVITASLGSAIPFLQKRRELLEGLVEDFNSQYDSYKKMDYDDSSDLMKIVGALTKNFTLMMKQGDEVDSMHRIYKMVTKAVDKEKEALAVTFAPHYTAFMQIDSGLESSARFIESIARKY